MRAVLAKRWRFCGKRPEGRAAAGFRVEESAGMRREARDRAEFLRIQLRKRQQGNGRTSRRIVTNSQSRGPTASIRETRVRRLNRFGCAPSRALFDDEGRSHAT